MAERAVGGTLVDTPLDQWASFRVPGLQRPHVARFCSREIVGFASAPAPGAVIDLALKIPSTVPVP